MRLIAVSRAAGMRLARELPATGAVPLLQRGAEITPAYATALIAQGIHAVWVDDTLSRGIQPTEILPEPVRQQAASTMRGAIDAAGEAYQRRQPLPEEVVKEVRDLAQRICSSVAGQPAASLALIDLADAHERVHRHSVNVCALGVLLGHQLFRRNGWIDWDGRRRRDRIEDRLVTLGVGLLLHDVGKVAIPAPLLASPGPYTHPEEELIRSHPEAGLALLRSDSVSLVVKAIVRDHHERWDGHGYPRHVARTDINPLARIAAVADLYDNATAPVADRPGATPAEAVAKVRDAAGSMLDPEVVEVFRRIVFPYPVGTEIDVDQGIVGVVATVDPANPDVPIVRFQGPDGPLELPIDTRNRPVRAA